MVWKILAVLLVIPIALIAVICVRWDSFEFTKGFGIIVQVIVGAIGFGLLGLANYLWTLPSEKGKAEDPSRVKN